MKQFVVEALEWAGSFAIKRAGEKKTINIRVMDNECSIEYQKLTRQMVPIVGKKYDELTDAELDLVMSNQVQQLKLLCPELLDEDLRGLSLVKVKDLLTLATTLAAGGAADMQSTDEKKTPSAGVTQSSKSQDLESRSA